MTGTFTITDISSATVCTLLMPKWEGSDAKTNMNPQDFTFVSGDFSVIDEDLQDEPWTITGYDIWNPTNVGSTEYRVCFPLCFTAGMLCLTALGAMVWSYLAGVTYNKINTMMNRGHEVRVAGINSERDAVYIIKSFTYRYIEGSLDGFEWTLDLEFVRY